MKNIFYLIIMSLSLVACQEVYDPGNLDSSELIPVIQGQITNSDDPCYVSVSYAKPFGASVVTYVNDAKVSIADNLGNRTTLTKVGSGLYQVEQSVFKGVPGRRYIVTVELKSGNAYVSDSVRMPMPATLDSISAKHSTYNKLITNADGDSHLEQYPALELMCNVSANDKDYLYNRFVVKAIAQKYSSTLAKQENPFPISIYNWTSSMNLESNANQVTGITTGSKSVVTNKHVGYLVYEKLPGTDTTTEITSAGWIVTTYVYRISAQSFLYYDKIQKQLEAKSHFFDPVPSQIKGNFTCVNKPEANVLGMFEANTQIKRYNGFSWHPSVKGYEVKDLTNFVDTVQEGRSIGKAPDFWIYF